MTTMVLWNKLIRNAPWKYLGSPYISILGLQTRNAVEVQNCNRVSGIKTDLLHTNRRFYASSQYKKVPHKSDNDTLRTRTSIAEAKNKKASIMPSIVAAKVDCLINEIDIDASNVNWQKVNDEFRSHNHLRLKNFWPIAMLNLLMSMDTNSAKAFGLFKSLYDYVIKRKKEESISMRSYKVFAFIKYGSPDEISEALDIYDCLKEEYEIFDSTTATLLAKALCKTSRWTECFEMLTMASFSDASPHLTIHESILYGAVMNGELNLALEPLKLLSENLCHRVSVWEPVIIQGISNGSISLQFLAKSGITLSQNMVNCVEGAFKEEYDISRVKIGGNSRCPQCGTGLVKDQLTDDDFKTLEQAFTHSCFVKGDIYIKSTPKELKVFQNFLIKHPKFDVVIDGQNVIYKARLQNDPAGTFGTLSSWKRSLPLLEITKFFYERDMNILIVGKPYFNKLAHTDALNRMATIFAAESLSDDDAFMIFAALRSGKDTFLVSSDHFRDQIAILDIDKRNLFRKWQRSHLIRSEWFVTKSNGLKVIKTPIDHDVSPQKCENGWHFPYQEEKDEHDETAHYDVTHSWLCLQNKS